MFCFLLSLVEMSTLYGKVKIMPGTLFSSLKVPLPSGTEGGFELKEETGLIVLKVGSWTSGGFTGSQVL